MSTRAEQLADAAGIPADPAEPWEDFVPLGSRTALPAFPLASLPGYLADMVAAVAEEMQVPTDLPGGLVLAVLSTAAGGRAEAAIRGTWREPLNVYVAVAMPPGSGKSPVFRVIFAPVFAAEKAMRAAAKDEIAARQAERRTALARAEADKTAAKKPEDMRAAVEAIQMAEEMQVPPMPRLTADDVSPEQASTIMADQRGRLAIVSAEGTFFEVIMGRYSNGRPNVELVLKAHAGDPHQVDRRGREETIERPALTLGIAIQPSMLKDIAAKPQMRGRGVLGRFLFSVPRDFVGDRKITPDVIPDDVMRTYNDTIEALIIRMAEWTDPAIIPLTPAALKVHTEWRAEIEPRLKQGSGDLESLRDWASKLAGATARLAGLLHLAEHPKQGPKMPIDESTMRRAVDLARYYAEHAMAAFGVMRAHPMLDDARAVLEWIGDRKEFKPREVHRSLHRRFETADDVTKVLILLEQHGYIRMAESPSTGGRKPIVYHVHPRWR